MLIMILSSIDNENNIQLLSFSIVLGHALLEGAKGGIIPFLSLS